MNHIANSFHSCDKHIKIKIKIKIIKKTFNFLTVYVYAGNNEDNGPKTMAKLDSLVH
jgi:hypothetical protein